jgi:16S rRNA (guanine527-N7)-methyltransferase
MTVIDADSFAAAARATPAQVSDVERFRTLLGAWNERMNLVGPSAMAEFWNRHAWDSAQLRQLAPEALTYADLGAGAGLPGLVLAIMLKGRDRARVHLVESMAKRCRFLQTVADELALPVEVHNARAEDVKLKVDIVTARACAPMTRLLQFANGYLKRGAVGLFLKGRDAAAEVEAAANVWDYQAELLPSRSGEGHIVRVTGAARARS